MATSTAGGLPIYWYCLDLRRYPQLHKTKPINRFGNPENVYVCCTIKHVHVQNVENRWCLILTAKTADTHSKWTIDGISNSTLYNIWQTLIEYLLLYIINITNFWGDLTHTSAITKTLRQTRTARLRAREAYHCLRSASHASLAGVRPR